MKIFFLKTLRITALLFFSLFTFAQENTTDNLNFQYVSKDGKKWFDPSLVRNNDEDLIEITVWFNKQFLESKKSYIEKQKLFSKRLAMRSKVVALLKSISEESKKENQKYIEPLIKDGKLKDVEYYWIFNGFRAKIKKENLSVLKKIPGISKVFYTPKRQIDTVFNQRHGKDFTTIKQKEFNKKLVNLNKHRWNIDSLQVYKVWNNLNIYGKGTINAVHDFGFRLDDPVVNETIYQNSLEIPNNGIDDDKNGYIDDYNGFNFDTNSAFLNPSWVSNNRIIHGNNCAALIAGRIIDSTIIGIAPASKWIPIIATSNFEKAIEWAIEHEVDTYSMSFSMPNLGEYRSHWRKVVEQATYCGIYFVSGAGNFADPNRNQYAPVPIQMRNPEDIPEAVLGVAGVDSKYIRPIFSSKGPVMWETEHYKDGTVRKPDFSTFNVFKSGIDNSGKLMQIPLRGNSFSGPQMAGVISLMLSANPDLLPWEAKKILIETSKDILAPGYDYESGYGLIDAYKAVSYVLELEKD